MTNGVNTEVYEEEIIEDAPVMGLETPTEETPVVGVAYIAPTELGDLYLKVPDEATAFEALYKPAVQTVVTHTTETVNDMEITTPVYTEEVVEGEFVPCYEGLSVDVIGVIYNVDNTDPENPIVTPYDGWHVNTRGPMTLELEAFSVIPTHPRRVWA